MTEEGAITRYDRLYTGTDRFIEVEVLDEDDVPVNVAGHAYSWMLKQSRDDADAAALLTKTTGAGQIAVVGSYSATRAANTQRVRVAILSNDTLVIEAGLYRHELKRTDAGQAAVAVSAKALLLQAVHRS